MVSQLVWYWETPLISEKRLPLNTALSFFVWVLLGTIPGLMWGTKKVGAKLVE
jgi:hypothetical protein